MALGYRDVSVDWVAVCFGNLFGGLGKCSVGLHYAGRFQVLLWLGTRHCPEKVLLKRADVLPGPVVLLALGLNDILIKDSAQDVYVVISQGKEQYFLARAEG